MKAAVFSDSHGLTNLMCEALRRCSVDVIIHLGDHDRDAQELRLEFPHIPLYSVRGNCDLASMAPDRETVQLGSVKALICHGHLYRVKYSLDSLVYAAMEAGASLALYGHTHIPDQRDIGGVRLINPGSAGTGRRPTWALIETFDNGGIACDIKEL